MYLIEFKICVIAGNGSRVVVTHQIFIILIKLIKNDKNVSLVLPFFWEGGGAVADAEFFIRISHPKNATAYFMWVLIYFAFLRY